MLSVTAVIPGASPGLFAVRMYEEALADYVVRRSKGWIDTGSYV